MNTPCNQDCDGRTITCHSTCPKYLEWKTQHEQEKESKRKYTENCSRSRAKTTGYQRIHKAAIKHDLNGRSWK